MKRVIYYSIAIVILFACNKSETTSEKNDESIIAVNKIKEMRITKLLNKYSAIKFPTEGISGSSFTYEVQQAFKINSQELFMFNAYLEDIEETEMGIVIEYLCPLDKYYFISKAAIRIRLLISDSSAIHFLIRNREIAQVPSLRYIRKPDYYVIATINDVMRTRIYSLSTIDHNGDVYIDSDISMGIIAYGKFIDALCMPKDNLSPK